MEPFTLALTSGYLGNLGATLSGNILSEAGRGIRRAISGDNINRAFNRCVEAGIVAVAQSTASQEPEKTVLLKDILDRFFREPDVGGELSEILNGREPDHGELTRLFKEAGYDPETLPGVQFDLAIDAFAAAFLSAATLEPQLQPVIQTKQLLEQTHIQREFLDTMKDLAAFLKESKRDTIGIKAGTIIAENVVNGQQHRFPSGSGKEPYRSKKIHVENSNVGVVGDNATVKGGIHSHLYGDITFQTTIQRIQKAAREGDADPADILRLYCGVLISSLRHLPLRGMDLGVCDPTADQKRLELDHVYIELDTLTQVELTEEEKEESGDRDPFSSKKTRPVSAMEAALNHRRMVLLGDPGSGKSTFVNYLTLCLALHGFDPASCPVKDLSCWLEEGDKPVPIPVILRDFAGWLPGNATAEVKHLWDFILHRLSSQNLDVARDPLEQALENGNAILLLDGLDEVPTQKLRALIRDIVDKFRKRYAKSRFVVTCRVLSYQDPKWRLDPDAFPIFELAPFDEKKIDSFIEAWYGDLERLNVVDNPGKARRMAGQLKNAIRRSDLWRLAANPLLLTVMALVHTHKGRLPDARALLYEDTVDILLWRWEQIKTMGDEGTVTRLQDLLLDADRADVDLKTLLWKLAFDAHGKTGEGDDETPADIQEQDMRLALAALHPEESLVWADRVIHTIKLRAGLLLERQPGIYSFPHRTFQEYLAGAHLSSQGKFAGKASELVEEGNFWREVVLLAVGRLIYLFGDSDKPLALAGELCPDEEPVDNASWRKVWMAGEVLVEIGANRLKDSNLGKNLIRRVSGKLVHLIEGGHLEPKERVSAGNALAHLGDPRFDPDNWHLPKEEMFGFVKIPEGAFLMGTKEEDIPGLKEKFGNSLYFKHFVPYETPQHEVAMSEFYLSRYPVTKAQFRDFIQDSGHEIDEKWEQIGEDNHPVTMVSWHDAHAYCEWLSEKFKHRGWRVTLPTEAEWEKAARGGQCWRFSWGDAPDPDKANFDDTGVRGTSPVGCFPGGVNHFGLLDMSGNVWEWCSDWFDENYYKTSPAENPVGPDNGAARVIRGGSWDVGAGFCRAAIRNGFDPGFRNRSYGFRLAVRPGH